MLHLTCIIPKPPLFHKTMVAMATMTMVAMVTGTSSGIGSAERDHYQWASKENVPVDRVDIFSGARTQDRTQAQNWDINELTNIRTRSPSHVNTQNTQPDRDVSRDTHVPYDTGDLEDLGVLSGSGDDVFSGKGSLTLEAIVNTLKMQVWAARDSQIRTRSVLNVITERQDSLDEDLALIKGEIRELRRQQLADHDQLQVLHATVQDSGWATADLKSSQQRLRQDITVLKHTQTEHNDTLYKLEETSQVTFQELQDEVKSLRKEIKHDRLVLQHIQSVIIRNATRATEKAPETPEPPVVNQIPPWIKVKTNALEEASGGGASKGDNEMSSLEERNTIASHDLRLFLHREKVMRKEMDGFQEKFRTYDQELSRIYTLFYNLSLHMLNLENRLLVNQKTELHSEVSQLQQSFMNFTKHMLHLEQIQAQSKQHLNTSMHNRNDISELTDQLENHQMRIKTLEDLVLDSRHTSTQQAQTIFAHMNLLNSTVHNIGKKISTHETEAVKVINDLSDKMHVIRTQLSQTTERLLELEIKVLNSSLMSCQKDSKDMTQDQKISEFSRLVEDMEDRVGGCESKISRAERGLSRLFNEIETQGESIQTVTQSTQAVMQVLPDITLLHSEVSNLISHLPRDCTAALESLPPEHRRSGSYLIKPKRSIRSVMTYCQVNDGLSNSEAWTVIQRRTDGTLSFSQDWLRYKNGFGSSDKELWIGNDFLHYLTTQDNYQLRIDMWDMNNQYWYAAYDYFKVDEETTNYRLHIDSYHGNATDALKYSNFMPFSTQDRDNDASSTHCAKFYTAGWWYKHCHYCNLNGRYTVGVVWFNQDSDEWVQMKRTIMRIRPLKEDNNILLTSDIANSGYNNINVLGSGET